VTAVDDDNGGTGGARALNVVDLRRAARVLWTGRGGAAASAHECDHVRGLIFLRLAARRRRPLTVCCGRAADAIRGQGQASPASACRLPHIIFRPASYRQPESAQLAVESFFQLVSIIK